MPDNRPPQVVLPSEGELIDAGGDRYRFLATREVTDGKYGIWEAVVPPGGGPPPHLHTREEEGFYVIDGEIAVYVDGRRVVAGAGAFVNMPVGSTHWFHNEGDQPARMLIIVAPGGMEGLFRQTGRAVVDPASPIPPLGYEEKRRIAAAAPTFGIEVKVH